jgi:large subunit ribosomal protein L22
MKTIKANASFVRYSPRKLRLVADAVRKLTPKETIDYLRLLNKAAALPLFKVFNQALANAKNNFQMSPGNLVTSKLQIEEGPRGPKRMDKSHGARFDRGVKRRRMSHITLVLTEVEEKK